MASQMHFAAASSGGRAKSDAQNIVLDLCRRGFDSAAIRADLLARGYKKARISQLLAATSSSAKSGGQAAAMAAAVPPIADAAGVAVEAPQEHSLVNPAAAAAEANAEVPQPRQGGVAAQHWDAFRWSDSANGPALEPDVASVGASMLSDQLAGSRRSFRVKAVAGDGNCQFRSVARQVHGLGEGGHIRLRRAAVVHVRRHSGRYLGHFVGDQQTALREWADAMEQPGCWGDNLSLLACAIVVGRPIAVWRRDSEQPPTVLLPSNFNEHDQPNAIHVQLDERPGRPEHYEELTLEAEIPKRCGRGLAGPCRFEGGCSEHRRFWDEHAADAAASPSGAASSCGPAASSGVAYSKGASPSAVSEAASAAGSAPKRRKLVGKQPQPPSAIYDEAADCEAEWEKESGEQGEEMKVSHRRPLSFAVRTHALR